MIFFGMVAENIKVWRCFGMCFTMRSICTPKPMSSIRSDSSRTRNSHLSSSRFPRSIWSLIRPGVPTTRRGRRWSWVYCLLIDSPPIRNAVLMGDFGPSNWIRMFITCLPSSRVGVMTRAVLRSELSNASTRGIENAAVLPVPVWAEPKTSRPSKAIGIACA